jgi:hypothetical protein
MTGNDIFLPWSEDVKSVHTEHGFTGRFIDGEIQLPAYQALFAEI